MERALHGCVLEGYGLPSTSEPNFRAIVAILVCAAFLRGDPPLSLEALTRRLRVIVQPGLWFPTEALGRGLRQGAAREPSPALLSVGVPGHKRAVLPIAAPFDLHGSTPEAVGRRYTPRRLRRPRHWQVLVAGVPLAPEDVGDCTH